MLLNSIAACDELKEWIGLVSLQFYKSHSLLHGAPRMFPKKEPEMQTPDSSKPLSPTEDVSTTESTSKVALCTSFYTTPTVLLSVVPICIETNGHRVKSKTLLDTGAEVSLINESITNYLKLEGSVQNSEEIGKDPILTTKRVNFTVSA